MRSLRGASPAAIRPLLIAAACGALSACSVVGDVFDGDDPPQIVRGERIPILTAEQTLSVDPDQATPANVPPPYVNASWPQTGGAPTHAMQNPDGGGLSRAWRRSVGAGDSRDSRITAQPVIESGRIFAMDGDGEVVAFDADTGSQLWRKRLRVENDRDKYGFGGGLAIAGGRVIVASGMGLLAALDPEDGDISWSVETATPLHSAPTVSDGRVFVVSDDNVLTAMDANTGERLWSFQGITEPARLLTSPAPAVFGEMVVSPFGSGELVALNAASGQPIWSDTLTRAGRLAPISTLNDVAGSPVIYDGVVYAMSHSGVLAAVQMSTGERVWTLPAGGVNMPWLAGDSLFVVTGDAELVAIDRTGGAVRWMSQLPGFKNEEKRKNKISWAGPVLSGGQLVVVSSQGEGRLYDPVTGLQTGEFEPGDTFVSPIVADRTLYVLNSDGELSAYR